jgi:hypothetical protein
MYLPILGALIFLALSGGSLYSTVYFFENNEYVVVGWQEASCQVVAIDQCILASVSICPNLACLYGGNQTNGTCWSNCTYWETSHIHKTYYASHDYTMFIVLSLLALVFSCLGFILMIILFIKAKHKAAADKYLALLSHTEIV